MVRYISCYQLVLFIGAGSTDASKDHREDRKFEATLRILNVPEGSISYVATKTYNAPRFGWSQIYVFATGWRSFVVLLNMLCCGD